MSDLRIRFGRLVAAHRSRVGLTQDALAEKAQLSVEMIGRIESGRTGARFPTIQRLADALGIDPAQLFSSKLESELQSAEWEELVAKLSKLDAADLRWISQLIETALQKRR